jgi:hypothetical protein
MCVGDTCKMQDVMPIHFIYSLKSDGRYRSTEPWLVGNSVNEVERGGICYVGLESWRAESRRSDPLIVGAKECRNEP